MNKLNNKEENYIKKKIENWIDKEDFLFTICARPFRNNSFFRDIIENTLMKRGKVLYIWGNTKSDENMILNLNLKNRRYSYTQEGFIDCDLVYMNFKYVYNICKKYDLIIIDDVSAYSNMDGKKYISLIERLRKYSKKIIFYTIDRELENLGLSVYYMDEKNIFLEPRTIITRIDLKKDIPYMLYEYLLWYKDNKKNIVIYVPVKDDIDSVVNYYEKKLKLEDVKVINMLENKSTRNELKLKDKSIFLITSNMEDVLKVSNVDAIIVLFSENKIVDSKKILFMCGKIGFSNEFSEVLLVCNEESKEIEKSKSITRSFNKRLWKEELLKR